MGTFLKLIKSTQPRMLTSIHLACTRISATSIPLRSLSGTAVAHGISEDEIAAARKAWGDALVSISTAYDESGIEKATELAEGALDGAYGYNLGPVLFKPTLSAIPTTTPTPDLAARAGGRSSPRPPPLCRRRCRHVDGLGHLYRQGRGRHQGRQVVGLQE